MVYGIIDLLNSFGVEIGSFTNQGLFGLFVLSVFILFWIILYSSFSSGGKNKTPISKGVPPILSFIMTLGIFVKVNGNSIVLRTQSEVFGWVTSTMGYLGLGLLAFVFIGSSYFLLYKKNKSNFNEIVLAFSIWFSSELFVRYTGVREGMSEAGDFLIGSDMFGGVLAIINVVSLIFLFYALIKPFLKKGSNIAKGTTNKLVNYVKDINTSVKDVNDKFNELNILLKQGSQIYQQLSNLYSKKLELDTNVKEMLKALKTISLKVIGCLQDIQNIEEKKMVNWSKHDLKHSGQLDTPFLNSFKEIKLNFDNNKRILTELNAQVDSLLSNTEIKHEDLYKVTMSWYNFTSSFQKTEKVLFSQVNEAKSRLKIGNQIMEVVSRLENLSGMKLDDSFHSNNDIKKEIKNVVLSEYKKIVENKESISSPVLNQILILEKIFVLFVPLLTQDNLTKLTAHYRKSNQEMIQIIYVIVYKQIRQQFNKGINYDAGIQESPISIMYNNITPELVRSIFLEFLKNYLTST